jgi:hypothetical protein
MDDDGVVPVIVQRSKNFDAVGRRDAQGPQPYEIIRCCVGAAESVVLSRDFQFNPLSSAQDGHLDCSVAMSREVEEFHRHPRKLLLPSLAKWLIGFGPDKDSVHDNLAWVKE